MSIDILPLKEFRNNYPAAVILGMDNKEIRKQNLELLIEEAGSVVGLSEIADINPSYISQARSGTKRQGDLISRKLEKGCKKTHGWMDTLHHEIRDMRSHYTATPPEKATEKAFVFIDEHMKNRFYSLPADEKAAASAHRPPPDYPQTTAHPATDRHR